MSCTLFTAHSNGKTLVGYNFDWMGKGGKVWFVPPAGKDFGYMLTERFGRFVPYEGINEKGVFAGQTAVPIIKTGRSFSLRKKLSISTNIIKWIMESCSSCDEGIDIFKRTLFIFGSFLGAVQLHFMVADADGNSAIVELIDGEMKVLYGATHYQVMTNYYLSDPAITWPDPVEGCGGYDRFETAEAMLKESKYISKEGFKKILMNTCTKDWQYGGYTFNTLWSSIHDCGTLKSSFFYKMDYGHEIMFDLQEELKTGRHSYRFIDL
jgi:hypothetical protein